MLNEFWRVFLLSIVVGMTYERSSFASQYSVKFIH